MDPMPESSHDHASEAEGWPAQVFGPGSVQARWHVAFAARRCPICSTMLVSSPDMPTARRCPRCRLDWFAQHAWPDGRAKTGSVIAYFRVE